MDVLVGGGDRPPRGAAGRLRRWQPPRAVVVLLAVAVAVTALAGVAAVGRVARSADAVALEVDARAVVAVRTLWRDGVLLLDVRNDGRRPVVLDGVEVDVAGLEGGTDRAGDVIAPGQRSEVEVPFVVRSCEGLADRGTVELRVRPLGEPVQQVPLLVGPQGAVPAEVLAAGCRPVHSADAAVVAVQVLEGERRVVGDGVRGVVPVEVRNLGGDLDVVSVTAEVPGAIVTSGLVFPLPAGDASVLRLSFHVPDCRALRRTGRVVVDLRDEGLGARQIGFRATEDEEARTVRDVDLDVLVRACRDGAPLP